MWNSPLFRGCSRPSYPSTSKSTRKLSHFRFITGIWPLRSLLLVIYLRQCRDECRDECQVMISDECQVSRDDEWWQVMTSDDKWWRVMNTPEIWWIPLKCDECSLGKMSLFRLRFVKNTPEMWWIPLKCDDMWWHVMASDDVWWRVMNARHLVMTSDECLLNIGIHHPGIHHSDVK
jgi:hypothetical protein